MVALGLMGVQQFTHVPLSSRPCYCMKSYTTPVQQGLLLSLHYFSWVVCAVEFELWSELFEEDLLITTDKLARQ